MFKVSVGGVVMEFFAEKFQILNFWYRAIPGELRWQSVSKKLLNAGIFLLLATSVAEARRSMIQPLKADLQMMGNYTVPILDPQLITYSLNEVEVKWTDDGASQILKYDLPQTLTGVAEEIEVQNTKSQPGLFVGNRADCECISSAGEFACILKYKNLQGSLSQAQYWIDSMTVEAPVKNQLKRVAQVFACDPVGVLHFRTDQQPLDPQSSLRLELVDRVLKSSSCQL